MRKIALEEHFWTDGFPHTAKTGADLFEPSFLRAIAAALPDFSELRLAAMDAAGIEIAVLSLVSPGVQVERDHARAVREAQQANDVLAAEIDRHPMRFAGFAHLPLQEPEAAARELERCVRQLGFKGALVNGHSNGIYLDDARYLPFWERAAALGVPIYLHPVHMPVRPPVLADYPGFAASMWGWTAETGGHALRLVLSGLFDRFPTLAIILGHMGETLPYVLWRIDSRFRIYRPKVKLEQPPSAYIRRNFFATTAGACQSEALACAIAALGADRVMFSVDYPLEDSAEAARFIETAPITERERELICWRNAARMLGLPGCIGDPGRR
jgi:2,3-dihydroxybenzoate decarboxylase